MTDEIKELKKYYREVERTSMDLAREVQDLIHGIEGDDRDVGLKIWKKRSVQQREQNGYTGKGKFIRVH